MNRALGCGLAIAFALTAKSTRLHAQVDSTGPDEGRKGSLLVFPKVELRWNAAGTLVQDTFIKILNDFPAGVDVQLFYVNGDPPIGGPFPEPGWNHLDTILFLTQDQPQYWSAFSGSSAGVIPFTSLDGGAFPGRPDPDGAPGVKVLRGYILAWAVDAFGGDSNREIRWNHLKGEATIVNYDEGSAWSYGAYSFAALSGVNGGEPDATPGQLLLNGTEYDTTYDRLLFDFFAFDTTSLSSPTRTVTVDGELVTMRADVDLRASAPTPSQATFTFALFDQNENSFNGTQKCFTLWDQSILSNIPNPNFFDSNVIGSEGRARMSGVAGCTVFTSLVPLLGVHANKLVFTGPNPRVDRSGSTMVGIGQLAAAIRFDLASTPTPDPHSPSIVNASNATQVPDGQSDPQEALVIGASARLNRTGSLLIFPKIELKWNTAGQLIQDTFIQLSNNQNGSVRVLLAFVNGDPPLPASGPERAHQGWNRLFDTVVLTSNQPTYWSSSSGQPASVTSFADLDLGSPMGRPDPEDPTNQRGMRGFLLAWAVNDSLQEINWNHLNGRATVVNYKDGYTWDYPSYALRANSGVQGTPTDGVPRQLQLNGTEYDSLFLGLQFNFQAAGAQYSSFPLGIHVGSDTELVLLPVNLDLRQISTSPIQTKAKFDVWNQNETKFSGTEYCVSCWNQRLLSSVAMLNAFDFGVLSTDAGKARVNGVTSAACPGSIDAPLIGTIASRLTFPSVRSAGGSSLAGQGTQSGFIQHDAVFCVTDANCDDNVVCTCDQCISGVCQNKPAAFGNVDCSANQQPDLDDILCLLSGFASFANCPNGDLAPTSGIGACQGNGVIGLDDILAILAAFGGADLCACPN